MMFPALTRMQLEPRSHWNRDAQPNESKAARVDFAGVPPVWVPHVVLFSANRQICNLLVLPTHLQVATEEKLQTKPKELV